jgi:hypothetical protein
MKNHKHYYNWTIEWEQGKGNAWHFCLGRKVIQPYQGIESYERRIVTVVGTVDECIRNCEDIIDDIIAQQNQITEKVLNIS